VGGDLWPNLLSNGLAWKKAMALAAFDLRCNSRAQ